MKICLIGCGKMGASLLEGWSSLNIIRNVQIIEPNQECVPNKLINNKNFYFYSNLLKIKNNNAFDITVLAVKPQVMKEVVIKLSELKIKSNSWLSIAAGLPVRFFEENLGKNEAIVRTIPNTPSSIMRGITALFFNANCNKENIKNSILLMNAVGETVRVENEELMDSYTAVSGSGPAYIYYMVEAMIEAAIEVGINSTDAKILAEKTLIGSAYLLEKTRGEPRELRKAVTSPKGTTEAGLKVLMENSNFFNLVKKAIIEAKNRGKVLSKL